MAGELIYAFRVMRLPLLDAGGSTIGRLEDIVIIPGAGGSAPRVLGFVATSQRRKIFVNAGRLGALDSEGARLRSWDVDLKPFKPHRGEILIGRDLIDARIGDETVSDIALRPHGDGRTTWWEPAKVRLAQRTRAAPPAELPPRRLRRRARPVRRRRRRRDGRRGRPPARHAPERRRRLRAGDAPHPAPPARRGDGRRAPRRPARGAARGRAAADHRRARHRPPDQRARRDGVRRPRRPPGRDARRAARPDPRRDGRRRRRRDAPPAVLRGRHGRRAADAGDHHPRPDRHASPRRSPRSATRTGWSASPPRCSSCRPPFKPPTGTYLGVVHFQRLLREPPHRPLGECLEHEPTIPPDLPERDVAERLASYNMLAVGVTDEPTGCSGRSPSTTSSTARCPPAGASAGGWRPSPAAHREVRSPPGRREAPRGPDHPAPAHPLRVLRYDPEAFGRFAETIARTLGTARFLVVPDASSSSSGSALNAVAWRAAAGTRTRSSCSTWRFAPRPRTPRR